MTMARDDRKIGLAVILGGLLCVLAIAYNVSDEYFLRDVEGYFKRKIYYEKFISGKGLSEKKALYWKPDK